MLTLLLFHVFLLLITGSLGGAVLRLLRVESTSNGAHFFLATWLGTFLWGNLLLWLTPWMPMHPALAVLMLLIGLACFRCHPLYRTRPGTADLAAGALVLLGMLPVGLQLVTTSDAVSYHYDIHAWLAHVGTVPGMALFHSRFGFLSSWFTLPAVFNHGVLEGRMSAALGAFTATLTALQVTWALSRAGPSRADGRRALCPAEALATAALFLAMVFPIMLNLAATPSHDVPVALLTVLCFQTLLPVYAGEKREHFLPIVFAALAVTVKLSSLPVLAVAGVLCMGRAPRPWRYFLKAAVLGGVLILPWVINQIFLTGWPLYPLGLRLDLPWSLSAATQAVEVQLVRDYAPWPALKSASLPSVLSQWIQGDFTRIIAVIYLLAGLVGMLAMAGVKGRRKPKRMSLLPFLLGWIGCAFWLWTTAHPRFGWGYLAIPPAIWVLWLYNLPWKFPRIPLPLCALAALLSLSLPTLLLPTRTQRHVHAAIARGDLPPPPPAWVLPPIVPAIRWLDAPPWVEPHQAVIRETDLLPLQHRPMYFRLDPRRELRLRHPERGLRGGVEPIENPRTYTEFHDLTDTP